MLNRLFTSGYSGLRGWLLQRVTAVVMAVYSVLFMAWVIAEPALRYEIWLALFKPVWMRIATLLFLLNLIVHVWLGVRDIFKDYIPSPRLRRVMQWPVVIALLGYSVWSVNILWGLGLS